MSNADAVDGDVAIDDDMMAGGCHHGLDQRREPSWTQTVAEIAALARKLKSGARRRADEDPIADRDLARQRFDAPKAKWIAGCQIDA